MAEIQITDKVLVKNLEAGGYDEGLIHQTVRRTLQLDKEAAETSLTVVITGDEELHHLNKTYLGEDQPTDVLAFPSGEFDPEQEVKYLGDVIISYARAEAQARVGGHAPFDEVRLLVIHGILHLLGFDHGDSAAKAKMWAAQETILVDLGIKVTVRE